MRVLITGCGGMLGSSVYKVFKEKNHEVLATDIDLNEPWLKHMDVRDAHEVKQVAKNFSPELIIHLAALTNLEFCEKNPNEAYKTNFIGTVNIAKECYERNIPMVYISSAGVFDGTKYSYTEDDLPNPINAYGRTKFYGEIAVTHLLKKYFIARAGWMMGGGKKDKKFVSYIKNQAKSGKQVFHVVNDKFGVPTYTMDLAKNLELLTKTQNYGLYHIGCLGEASRLEIAKFILETLGVKNHTVKEVSSDFFQKDFPVQRASSERMVNTRLNAIGLNAMRDWKICLREYLKESEQ